MITKKNELPKITFVIPTLDAEKYLPLCLGSIRSQVYPKGKIEIIVSDGGSKDKTLQIARKYGTQIVNNPKVIHEHGKSLGIKNATGDIIFYTDSDNILSSRLWLKRMTRPYMENENIIGFLPQTVPYKKSNPLDRYLGYLFTDPFTWFVYGQAANPRDYINLYLPLKKNKNYVLFKFPKNNPPLFGLAQGVGTSRRFKRTSSVAADDMLSGIKLIEENGIVAYVPQAGVYHLHVTGFKNYVSKYSWRTRNNLTQTFKGMGIVNRTKYFSRIRKIRMYLFIPYSLSIIFPLIDGIKLSIKYKDFVMLYHVPSTFLMGLVIIKETVKFFIWKDTTMGSYK